MGSYISCALSVGPYRYSGVKVIFSGGEIRQLDRPVNAAELMLDDPNHFVVDSKSLQIGRRFCPLSADEDLELSNVYIMFPMNRVNSVITTADVARLFMNANSAIKRSSGGTARVLPENAGIVRMLPESGGYGEGGIWRETSIPRLNLDEFEDASVGQFKHRLSFCRSRKPMLETINEETVCTRG